MTQWGLDTLFNPAKRHMDEEKQRLQSTREEVGDASGGRRIDLDSGKVRISKPGSAQASAAEASTTDATNDPRPADAVLPTADSATSAGTTSSGDQARSGNEAASTENQPES